MSDKRIVLIDDHTLVQAGISELVDGLSGFSVIGKAENGRDGIELVKILAPDVVLMDVDMPVMNGIEATRALKTILPEVKVIVLTMHCDAGLIKRMMEIGADGFLLKTSDREEFEEALKRVTNHKTYFSNKATQALLDGKAARRSSFSSERDTLLVSTLSVREVEILKLIAKGLSNKEIGEQIFISHRTVDTHRTNIMKKLDLHNTAGLVKFAMINGMVD